MGQIIFAPKGKKFVTHRDGDGFNNEDSNLAWVTASERFNKTMRSIK